MYGYVWFVRRTLQEQITAKYRAVQSRSVPYRSINYTLILKKMKTKKIIFHAKYEKNEKNEKRGKVDYHLIKYSSNCNQYSNYHILKTT